MLSHTKQSPNITRYISISSQRTISDSNTFTYIYNTRNMSVCWCMSSVKGISILHMPRDIMYLSQAIKATHRHRSHFHHQTTTTTTVPTCLSLCKQNKMYTTHTHGFGAGLGCTLRTFHVVYIVCVRNLVALARC